MNKREKQWQLEDDARTLQAYASLMSEKERFEAAQQHIAQQTANLATALPNLTEALFGKKSKKKE